VLIAFDHDGAVEDVVEAPRRRSNCHHRTQDGGCRAAAGPLLVLLVSVAAGEWEAPAAGQPRPFHCQENSMKKTLPAMLAIALVGCAQTVPQPQAAEEVMVILSGAQLSPPVQTAAAGQATILVDEDGNVSGVVTAPTLPDATVVIEDDADAEVPMVVMLTPVAPGRWQVPAGTRLTGPQMEHYEAGRLAASVRTRGNPKGELRAQLHGKNRTRSMGNR
jgi:hypothetical protein